MKAVVRVLQLGPAGLPTEHSPRHCVPVCMFKIDIGGSWALEAAFWAASPLVFVLAWRETSVRVSALRFRVNEWVVRRLVFLDLADNPELIQSFGLVGLLRSATRLGASAASIMPCMCAGSSEASAL